MAKVRLVKPGELGVQLKPPGLGDCSREARGKKSTLRVQVPNNHILQPKYLILGSFGPLGLGTPDAKPEARERKPCRPSEDPASMAPLFRAGL